MHYEDIKNIITRLETIAKSPVSEDPEKTKGLLMYFQKKHDDYRKEIIDVEREQGKSDEQIAQALENNDELVELESIVDALKKGDMNAGIEEINKSKFEFSGVPGDDDDFLQVIDKLGISKDTFWFTKNESFEPFPEADEFNIEEDEDFEQVLGVLGFPEDELWEAEYRGRKVKLNKPMRGDVKKFKVFVKDPKSGNVKKVNFGHGGTSAKKLGQKTMRIRKSDPARRRSFRARHNCANPGPKTKARYWSCRKW